MQEVEDACGDGQPDAIAAGRYDERAVGLQLFYRETSAGNRVFAVQEVAEHVISWEFLAPEPVLLLELYAFRKAGVG